MGATFCTVGAPLLEKIMRPCWSTCFLVVALRVFGKRELAQLNPFDLVVLLSLSNTVQNAIIGNDNSLTGGLIGALALLLMNYLVVRFLFRHRRLDQMFEGKPTVLSITGTSRRTRLPVNCSRRAELMTVFTARASTASAKWSAASSNPAGRSTFSASLPSTDKLEHDEVMRALADLSNKVDALAPNTRPGMMFIIRMTEEWVSG